MRNILTKDLIAMLAFIFFELLAYCSSGQGVGIGTSHPQAKLHVAGDLRIDSAALLMSAKRIAVLDNLGTIHSYPLDSLRGTGASGMAILYSQEVTAQSSTTSSVPQARVTLTLPAGTYLLFAYFEAFNGNVDAGVRATLNEGISEIGYGIVWSNTSTFGSWSCTKGVSPSVTTTYTLCYSSWPNATTSYVRRARIVALKTQ